MRRTKLSKGLLRNNDDIGPLANLFIFTVNIKFMIKKSDISEVHINTIISGKIASTRERN